MSRQINFFHLESDIEPLLQMIESAGGLIYLNGEYHRPTEICPRITANMSTWTCQYSTVLSSTETAPTIGAGRAIEFLNCKRGEPESDAYQGGRFYLCRTQENEFVPELNQLYSQMAAYIKKNYRYSRACYTYFSPEFLEKSKAGQVVAGGPGKTILQFDRVILLKPGGGDE